MFFDLILCKKPKLYAYFILLKVLKAKKAPAAKIPAGPEKKKKKG